MKMVAKEALQRVPFKMNPVQTDGSTSDESSRGIQSMAACHVNSEVAFTD